jgi:flagellar hook-basal body complex protein FliE
MMNPLDALSALSKVAAPMGQMPTAPALPTGAANAITENFNLLQQPTATNGIPSISVPDISMASTSSGGSASPATWGHMVQQMVMDVNSKQQDAAQKVTDVLKGGPTPVHEAMVASEEASLSFEFLAEMRNKVVEAYQQVMQMQV